MSLRRQLRSPAVRIAGFALILAAAFGTGAAVGAAVGPALDGRVDTSVPVAHEGHEG
jgi:hypothetical protein